MKKFLYLVDNYSFSELIKISIKRLYNKWHNWLNKYFDKELVESMDELNKIAFYIWKYFGPLLLIICFFSVLYLLLLPY